MLTSTFIFPSSSFCISSLADKAPRGVPLITLLRLPNSKSTSSLTTLFVSTLTGFSELLLKHGIGKIVFCCLFE